MATPPLRHDFFDVGIPGPNDLPAAEYNLLAQRADAAYDAAATFTETHSVTAYGADPTGTTGDLGAIITSLASTLHTAGGGTIVVPPGTYRFTTTGTYDSPKVNLIGAGSSSVKFVPAAALGTAACLDINGQTNSSGDCGPKVGGFTIDGAATPSGVGLAYGDLIRGHLDDIFIDNYSTGKALRFLNRVVWTERTLITRLTLGDNNKIGWSFEDTTGLANNSSFGYTRALDCAINMKPVTATTTVASVTTTAGSTSATVASGGFPSVTSGKSVDGTGLYGGTTVANVSGNTLTLSIPAKTSGTQTLSFAANNQTGLYFGPAAYFYNSDLNLTANIEGGTAGTNQSPVLLKVDDGAFVENVHYGVDAEEMPGGGSKATAVWVGAGSTFRGTGFTSLWPALLNSNYVSDTALVVQLGGTAHWGFVSNDDPAALYSIGNNTQHALRGRRYYESYDRVLISHDGSIWLGNGGSAVDTQISRTAFEALKVTGNLVRGGVQAWNGDGTVGVGKYLHVLFGTVAHTLTLPALAGNTGAEFLFKNRSTQVLTVQRAGSDEIYDTAAVNSITVAAGSSARLINDGTYWLTVT